MAVETVREALNESRPRIHAFAQTPSDEGRKELVSILEAAVRQAHQAVYERGAAETDKQGMGTTLDVVLLAGPEAFVAHVGDSRTYLVRDGKAAQITTDHTVAEVLVIEGKLSVEEAQISPLRTILVNAIGVAPDVGVEMAHVKLRKGDQLLLCSDGLHDYFPLEQELADHMTSASPEKSLAEMVDLAKNRGGHDNITGVIVEVLEAPRPETDAPRELRRDGSKGPGIGIIGDGSDDVLPDEETMELPIGTARTEEFPAAKPDDADLMETVRLKRTPPPTSASAKPMATASAGPAAKSTAATAATAETSSDDESATEKSSRKRRRRKRRRKKKKRNGGGEDMSRADTLPPYGAKPNGPPRN
jgi:serine/threonine protein phosphatase PrpC